MPCSTFRLEQRAGPQGERRCCTSSCNEIASYHARKEHGDIGGFGYYNERVAGSASVAFRINDSTVLNGGVAFGWTGGKAAGFKHLGSA